jgi:hypothetical protein
MPGLLDLDLLADEPKHGCITQISRYRRSEIEYVLRYLDRAWTRCAFRMRVAVQ